MIYNSNTLSFIKNISFLKKVPESDLDEILSVSEIRNIKKNEIMYLEGEPAVKFYIILNGTFKLYNETLNGNESVRILLSSSDFFGERSLSDDPFYSSSCEATKNSQVLVMPSDILKEKIQKDYRISYLMFTELLKYQSNLESRIEYLSVMNASQRIAWYLIDAIKKTKNANDKLHLQHDKSLIATFLGMKPETFSRSIKKLEDADVYVNGSEIIIKNINLLQKYCSDRLYSNSTKIYKYNN